MGAFTEIRGTHITVLELNVFFKHVTAMLLEHFDRPRYAKTLFLLGTYVHEPVDTTKTRYDGFKVIVYQLEQLMAGTNWHDVKTSIKNLAGADEIWDFDYLNSHFLKEHGRKVDRLVPTLYTKSLNVINSLDKPSIDVLFYGYMNERRFKIFHTLQKRMYNDIKLLWVFGDSDVDRFIADSKVILNLHAFEPYNRQEQVRLFYPIINRKTVISEISQLNNLPGSVIESTIEELPNTIRCVCKSDIWKEFGKQAALNLLERTEKFISETEQFNDAV